MTSTLGRSDLPLQAPAALRRRLLDPDSLAARQSRADRLLGSEGAGHLVHDLPVRSDGRSATLESRPWRVDPIPVVLDAGTFQWLSLAVTERMLALDAVVADLYGERQLVREGIVPAEAIAGAPRYCVDAVGTRPTRWLSMYAVDVVLDATGMWWHVADFTDAPPGLGYALLDRSVMSRVVPDLVTRSDVVSLGRFPGRVRRALAALSDSESPRTVLYSGGLDHASYVDHSYLAVQLGVNLVEGADLVVRQRKVWLRTLDGLEPVDVLYRRLEDRWVDPLARAPLGSIGVPGVLLAQRSGGVAFGNAYGTGVLEAPEVRPYLSAAIDRLRPLTQILPGLPDHVDAGGYAMVPLAPGSVDPSLDATGVTIRLFAVSDGTQVHVLPGGTGRVLAPGDHPAQPTACTAKDVWVLGWTPAPVIEPPRLPQVDFGRSVPTRAADALYWMNRSAERAEAMARTMRVVSARIENDPGLGGLRGGMWCDHMRSIATRARRATLDADATASTLDVLEDELAAVGDALASEVGVVLTEATTVREFMSVTAGRVLAHLAELRAVMQAQHLVVDDLDAVLADFAAIGGLWQESTVRGPAWRIGDTGRRLERCLVVIDLVEGALAGGLADDGGEVDAATVEVLLAANDSLVAYRRRHRSDVEVDLALRLLLHDATNPRSLAASIDRLAAHVADGEDALGGDFIADARAALELPTDELLVRVRELVDEAGRRIVGRWFSTPVNPVPLTSTGPGQP